jgi:hypothetical protein
MSRISLALLSVIALAACGESGQPLAPATAPNARRAAAETTTESYFTVTNAVRFVPCANGGAGEVVDISGTVHRVEHVTETENGFHLVLHANPIVTGVGRTTGDTYQARGGFNLSFNVGPGETETVRDVFKLVGPGPNNNLTVTFAKFHYTINANGELVVLNEDAFSVECT